MIVFEDVLHFISFVPVFAMRLIIFRFKEYGDLFILKVDLSVNNLVGFIAVEKRIFKTERPCCIARATSCACTCCYGGSCSVALEP